jgi:hypothetical protein
MASNSKNIAELLNNGTQIGTSAIADGAINNDKVSSGAAIVTSKLSGLDVEFTDVRNDVSTVALATGIADNKAAFNLPNAFVDQFEDDTGIDTETNTNRLSVEKVGSRVTTIGTGAVTGNITLTGRPNSHHTYISGSWTGGQTNDTIKPEGSRSPDYTQGVVGEMFDLAYDFDVKVWVVDDSGNKTTHPYLAYSPIIITDTTYDAGEFPAGAVQSSGDDGGYYGYIAPGTASTIFQSSFLTTTGIPSISNYNASGSGTGAINANCSSSDAMASKYYNNGNARYGIRAQYTRSTNTMIVGMMNASSGSFDNDGKITFTNVPTTGRFILPIGEAQSMNSANKSFSTTFNGATSSDYGTRTRPDATIESISATGNFTGVTQTASASVDSMGAVILYENTSGTATLNTDLSLELSADGGSNYTTATLIDGGTYSGNIKIAKVGGVSVTSGTQPKYRISFANQSDGVKETRVVGVGLTY